MVPVATIRWQEPPFRQGLLRQAGGSTQELGLGPKRVVGVGCLGLVPTPVPLPGGPGKPLPRAQAQ